jgi:Predicted membrane protein
MNNLTQWIVSLLPFLLVAAALISTPYASLRTPFGVSVPADERLHPAIRALRKSYALMIAAAAVVAALVVVITGSTGVVEGTDELSLLGIGATLFLLLIGFAIFVWYHRRMLTLKEQEGWQKRMNSRYAAAQLSFRNGQVVYGIVWFVPHLVVIAACAFIAILSYDSLPDVIPTHFDWDGTVTEWSEKTWGSVLSLNIIQLVMTAIMVFVNTTIRWSRASLDPNKPEQSAQAERKYRRSTSLFILVFSFLLILMMGWIQAISLYERKMEGSLVIVSMLPLVVAGIWMVWLFRMNRERSQFDRISRDQDQHWKLGSLYWNPEDPAIFVEKRSGIGWTLNFAKPLGWLVLFGPIVIIALVPLFDSRIMVRKTTGVGWTFDFTQAGTWIVLALIGILVAAVLLMRRFRGR